MSHNLYKKFIQKINNFGKQIYQIENSVLDKNENYKEIFERNYVLEQEIAERTEELNQANKSLLTLKHIWSTMNSSEPLSEVLSTVVNRLSEELGYLYCFIFQMHENLKVPRLKIRAASHNNFADKIGGILPESIYSYDIPLDTEENIIIKAMHSNEIITINTFSQLFYASSPGLRREKMDQLDGLFMNRSVTILPISVNEKPFGCLVAISIRNEISSIEKNFLSLCAGQIELAITITGLFEKIREQAITDGLTGLYNRRHFDQCLTAEVERSLRLKQPFTLITLDLDHLKFINDTYGHSAGDAAIKHIGSVLKQKARSIDIAARFGGEEFAIILPGIEEEGGMIAAERLRTTINSIPVEDIGVVVTASIGVATFLKHTDKLNELLELVDQAMYRAKRMGRNQVQLACLKEEDTNWQMQALLTFIDILTKHRVPIPAEQANDLINKLKIASMQPNNLQDFLFEFVDSLAKSYSSVFRIGNTRDKIEIITRMAGEINLPEPEINNLILAALLNDIGTLLVPENILLKPGTLTDEERSEVEKHPIIAAKEILKGTKTASRILPIIEHHHEKWDGTGYPDNLRGDKIPLGSRIILIVDSYFSMINDRPFRKAMSHQEAILTMTLGANSEWDGKLVDLFVRIIHRIKEVV